MTRVERYVVKEGRSELHSVHYFECRDGASYKVRKERHRSVDGTSVLLRVRWSETETGSTDYYDADGVLLKRKIHDPLTTALAWILEYHPATGAMESARRYSGGKLVRAILFDEDGDIRFTTDRKGRDLPKFPAIFPEKSTEDVHAVRFPAILLAIEELNHDVRLLFLGDSITMAWTSDADVEPIWNEYYGDRRAVNAGVGYDQTQNLLWRLDNGNLDGIRPDFVVLNIGTNNLNARSQANDRAEEVVEGILASIAKVKARVPAARLVVMGVFPRGPDDSEADIRRRQVNSMLAPLDADPAIHFVDLAEAFAPGGQRDLAYYRDDLHLSAAGYRVWAAGIEDVLASSPE